MTTDGCLQSKYCIWQFLLTSVFGWNMQLLLCQFPFQELGKCNFRQRAHPDSGPILFHFCWSIEASKIDTGSSFSILQGTTVQLEVPARRRNMPEISFDDHTRSCLCRTQGFRVRCLKKNPKMRNIAYEGVKGLHTVQCQIDVHRTGNLSSHFVMWSAGEDWVEEWHTQFQQKITFANVHSGWLLGLRSWVKYKFIVTKEKQDC